MPRPFPVEFRARAVALVRAGKLITTTPLPLNWASASRGDLPHATLRRAKVDVLATLERLDVRLFSFAAPTKGREPRHPSPRNGSNPLIGDKLYLT